MKISESDRRTRTFPLPIRTVSSLNGQRTSTIEPWIMRRERFSRRRNEPAHPINDYSSHLIGRSRSVTRDKAVTPIIVSVEATQGPPISPIKVPEKTHGAGWSCWRESIKIKRYKVVVRFTNRSEGGVFIERRISGETYFMCVQELVGTIRNVCGFFDWLLQIVENAE